MTAGDALSSHFSGNVFETSFSNICYKTSLLYLVLSGIGMF